MDSSEMFRESLDDPIRKENIHQGKKINRIELRSLRHNIICTSESPDSPRNKLTNRGDASPGSPTSFRSSNISSHRIKKSIRDKKNSVRNHRV